MGTNGTSRGRTSRLRSGTLTTRALLALTATTLLLAGCSAGGDTSTAGSGIEQGGAADSGGVVGGESGAEAGGEAGGPADEAGSTVEGEVASGTGSGLTSADAGERQVITSGTVALVADDPRDAADRVVAEVERAGGRVDARQETAARADQGVTASAELTVRLPADGVSGLLDALDTIGEVDSVDLRADDVTAAAQDLDARIAATELSVARMADLLEQATSREEVLAAEGTLTDRQATLEQLVSERSRIAEQVALSTLRLTIGSTPAPVAPAPEPDPAPSGFLGGLDAGWSALVAVLGVVVLVMGALLPWLAVAAGAVAAALGVRRAVRRRSGGGSAAPAGGNGAGGPGGRGRPGSGGPGPAGPGSSGPGTGGPGADDPGPRGPAAPEDPDVPVSPVDPERSPVGAGPSR